jgi:YVTN family beta-propeller protein
MARFLPSLGNLSGRLGNLVFSGSRYGPTLRRRSLPTHPTTLAVQTSRARQSASAAIWRSQICPAGYQIAWAAFARAFPLRGASGTSRAKFVPPHLFAIAINNTRQLLGLQPLLFPPDDWGSTIPNPAQYPVSIQAACVSGVSLSLTSSPSPLNLTGCGYIVRATPPLPRGVTSPPQNAFRVLAINQPLTKNIANVTCGTSPLAVAVNSATNKIYVANLNSNTCTVIDGVTLLTQTVTCGSNPNAVAANSATNKIYVANLNSNTCTVIDGVTLLTQTVTCGSNPNAVAVNSVTNKIYVANYSSATCTVIDGVTLLTQTVTCGSNPRAVAVNSVTNKIYVANFGSGTCTVIDGVTLLTQTVTCGTNPYAVAVNSVTNKIYVANTGSVSCTVIDGVTLLTQTVTCGSNPRAVDVNSVTNKIYVANFGSGTCTVIDGVTLLTQTVTCGSGPWAVAVNSVTNKIYVANTGSVTCTVIDGVTLLPQTVTCGSNPYAVAVNSAANKVYVPNYGSASLSVLDPLAPNPVFPTPRDLTAEYRALYGAIPSKGQRAYLQLNIVRLYTPAGNPTAYTMLPLQCTIVPA